MAEPKMTRTTLDVLSVLVTQDQELYGLKIAQATGVLTGTIYPILARLEQAGWVTSEWESGEEPDSRGPRRRFYRLTPNGLQRAQSALQRAASRRTAAPGRPGAAGPSIGFGA
ncbi:PadR family transcriptional regulator [Streptomyces sp. KLMMK]|uniref:PadR family transcriptional regulator n=1 Tax=Streptomyces sp. KLMMK TaxID=3109353 RepID=UPI002FFE68BD